MYFYREKASRVSAKYRVIFTKRIISQGVDLTQSFVALHIEAPLYNSKVTISTLDSSVGSLPNDQPVIIITASYEEKPCKNAK